MERLVYEAPNQMRWGSADFGQADPGWLLVFAVLCVLIVFSFLPSLLLQRDPQAEVEDLAMKFRHRRDR